MATTRTRRVAFRTPLITKIKSGGTVESKLVPTIKYPVIVELDREDVGYQFFPMAGYFQSTPLIIAVGKVRYDYLGNGILYVPVYLVTPDIKLKAKIGIFEFRLSYENVKWIDETDMERFTFNEFTVEDYMNFINNTLLFDGVNTRYLQQFVANDGSYTKVGIGIPVDELIAVIKEASEPAPAPVSTPEPVSPPVSTTETETAQAPAIESDKPTPTPTLEPEPEKPAPPPTPTTETEIPSAPLTILPRFPDDTTPLDYSKFNIAEEESKENEEKSAYDAIVSSAEPPAVPPAPINDALESMEFKVVENGGKGDCFFESVQQAFESIGKDEITIAKQREFLSDKADDDVFEQYKILDQTSDLDEYKFKSPTPITLEEFKAYMKTQNFWADEYAISQLEQHLNVRFVILLQDKYALHGSMTQPYNIISCGIALDPSNTEINPAYYIILTLGGAHYRLVTYQTRSVHTSTELPYIIKKHIIASCMVGRDKKTNVLRRRDNTLYSQIPIFREMRDYMMNDPRGKLVIERMMPPVRIGPEVGGQRRTSYRATLKHPRPRLSLSGTRKNRGDYSATFSSLPQIRRNARR